MSPGSSQGFCSKLGSPPQGSSVSEFESEKPLGNGKNNKDQTPQHNHHTTPALDLDLQEIKTPDEQKSAQGRETES